VYDFMAWLEESTLGYLMRDAGLWVYPSVNLLHILGLGALFGAVVILDLRLLGCWARVPLSALSGPASRVAQAGFAVAATTGIGLLATKATDYVGNPYFLIKFPAIAVGLLNVVLLYRTAAWRAHLVRALSRSEERTLALMGGISLASWLTAITAGRMIAYW
jgi:hypothetical protein